MSSATTPETPALVGDVPSMEPVHPADPFQALDDLLVVLESLCTRWPTRPPATDAVDMRL